MDAGSSGSLVWRCIVKFMRPSLPRFLKAIPYVQRFAHSARGQALRHRLALHLEDRKQYTFTQFFRLPSQLDALTGPVLDFLNARHGSGPIRIVVIGCSTGAEPYTLSSVMLDRCPTLTVTIDAYDIDAEVLTVARDATYAADEVLAHSLVSSDFVTNTFDQRDGNIFEVKSQVARRVHFHQADFVHGRVEQDIAAADIVFAQNVMCNLRRPAAARLFDNAVALLKPRSALFVDGMDLDMREQRTRIHGLVPLTFALERIHDEARLVRGERYPWYAAGLEPFSPTRRNCDRRYSTIFLRGSGIG
jgi:chemotaxis protein methyltransferase CheR